MEPLKPTGDDGPEPGTVYRIVDHSRRVLVSFAAAAGGLLIAVLALVVMTLAHVETSYMAVIMTAILGFTAVLTAQAKMNMDLSNAISEAQRGRPSYGDVGPLLRALAETTARLAAVTGTPEDRAQAEQADRALADYLRHRSE